MKIRNIIWDWNGTLVNDTPAAHSTFNHLLETKIGRSISLEGYREIYQHPIENMYRSAGFDLKVHPYEDLCHEFHLRYTELSKEIGLQHDSLSTLEWFRSRACRQFILSALPHELLTAAVDKFEVREFFEVISGLADNLGRGKIDTGTLLLAAQELKPEETVLIGDSSHDAEVADTLGISCILVARGFESRSRLEQNRYPVTSNFSEALNLL